MIENLVNAISYYLLLEKVGGGGGGGRYIQSSTKSSQVMCRTDPQNPGQQICKRVERYSYTDPQTGK